MLSINICSIFSISNFYFVANIRAYDRIWVIGDQFMEHSFEEHFQFKFNPNLTNYVKTHYDVTGFCAASPQNILTRIVNSLVKAINEQVILPKAVILVFYDDILDAINHYDSGISYPIGKAIEWLANKIHDTITAHKEQLPNKSRKLKYPAICWSLIPLHDIYGHYNEFKEKFNKAVKRVTKLFGEMFFLELDAWDRHNLEYFAKGWINSHGLGSYWRAISDSFETWDRFHMSNTLKAAKRMNSLDKKSPPNQDMCRGPNALR